MTRSCCRARPPRPALSPFVLAFLGSFCLVATAGLAWSFSLGLAPRSGAAPGSPTASLASAPASFPAGARRGGRAEDLYEEDLYERIEISMSLYDVDQTAGGMGRLAHSSDPHPLLLSYDYLTRACAFRSSGTIWRVTITASRRSLCITATRFCTVTRTTMRRQ